MSPSMSPSINTWQMGGKLAPSVDREEEEAVGEAA